MSRPRVKANKNRKGKERKVRCNRCGYARIKESRNFLHENLLIIGYANKSDFKELFFESVRCHDGSIGNQQGKHFYHKGVYYYYRAPYATVTCLYKRSFFEGTRTRRLMINDCGYIRIKDTKTWEHDRWLGVPSPDGFYKVDLTKFQVSDYKGTPSCRKHRKDEVFGPPAPVYGPTLPPVWEYIHRYQRGIFSNDGIPLGGHFYHPESNSYFVYFGADQAGKKVEFTYNPRSAGYFTYFLFFIIQS